MSVMFEGGSDFDQELVPQHEVVGAEELMDKFGFTDQDEDETQEESDQEAEQEREEPVVEAKPEPEKQYTNPNARIRILEKQNKTYKKTIEETNSRMARLENLLLKKNEPQEEEQLPDLAEDPFLRIDKRLDQVEKRDQSKREQDDKEKELNSQVQNVGRVLQEADAVIAQRLPQLENYDQAGQYLLNHLFERAIDLDNVDSEQEAWNQVQIWINETKIASLASGVNPADQFMGMARYFGWTPSARQTETKPEAKKKEENPREVIKRQREKEKGSRSISAVSGTTAKASIPFGSMKSEDLQAHFRQLKKQGGKNYYKNDPAVASVSIEV